MAGHPADSTLDATCPARPDEEDRAPAPDASAEVEPEVVLGAGERAGDFVIEGVLGRGSFGTVYRAAHAVIGRRAAVKVLREHAAEAAAIESFIDEARLVARLRHPNIVDVLGFGRLDDGRQYQVMDLIEGPTLTDFMRERGALSLTEALPILRGVASALDAVHRAGVAHSDLKPANVVLERRESELVPKLIDFGVAKLIAPDAERASAARGARAGTPRYMSPEQCRGRAVDARTDSYAFGLLAYEILTGEPPFSGDDALELMLKHTSAVPVRPSRLCASLPPAVDPIIVALLDKRPERRPAELARVVQGLEAAASSQEPSKARDRPERRFWRTAFIAGAGLAVAAVALLIVRQRDGVAEAADTTAATTIAASFQARAHEPHVAPLNTATAPPNKLESDGGTIGSKPSLPDKRRTRAPKQPVADDTVQRSRGAPGLEDPENPFNGR